jgi:hypothetical protein
MKHSPEDLEKFIHRTLRALPDRRAPRSLESRVLAAIEARAAQPWWKQSFAEWPIAARCVFLLFTAGLVKFAVMATMWAMAGVENSHLASTFTLELASLERIGGVFAGIRDFCALLFRSIPSVWLYGGLAAVAAIYATLFGLGATAYRALYSNRH